MNLIRLLRSQSGVTQQTLAALAGTSQPTIALYESGAKSPTVATLQRLASSLGLEAVVTYTPHLTREDQRSLAYHRAVANILGKNLAPAIKRAKQCLNRMDKQHPETKALFDRWRLWLDLPTDELIYRILDPGLTARDMRQVTPFAGLLKPGERCEILHQFRKEHKP